MMRTLLIARFGLSLLWLGPLATAQQPAEPRLALIMGVGDYSGTQFPTLPGINMDLKRMETVLKATGFQVTVVSNPTLGVAEEAVESFGAKLKAQAGGVGLFYFSGHGGEFEGKNYLIPKGARLGSPRDIKEQAVAAQRVLNRMEESGSRVNIVFLDCCRSDLTKGATGGGLAAMTAKGTFIGFATDTDKTSAASTDGSPYTAFLAKRILTPGISITDMHTQVTADVEDFSKANGLPDQTPFQYSGLRSSFVFMPGKAPDPNIEAEVQQRLRAELAKLTPRSTPYPSAVTPNASVRTVPATPAPNGGGAPVAATKDKPFVNSLGMKFVPVPIVGGATDGQNILFSVWDTRIKDYDAFIADTQRPHLRHFGEDPTEPVVMVSWDDAVAFCAWLSSKEGRTYRLPSDHEWSCAVGIGELERAELLPEEKIYKLPGVYPWGKQWPPPPGVGNYWGLKTNQLRGACPVGSFPANRFGLFDMGGNVWQWCQDWMDRGHSNRVLRGASWNTPFDRGAFSSNRYGSQSSVRANDRGFRCVLAASGG